MIVNNMTPLNRSLAKESSPKISNLELLENGLPSPSEDAISHSKNLLSYIQTTINSRAEGSISFAEYMQLTLFAPGLGYYSAGSQKFGAQGDFITAPEFSPLFSQCLAHQCYEGLSVLGDEACLLEIGAGSGQMAVDILRELRDLKRLPKHYYILELSAELKDRQQQTLKMQCPELLSLVQWLDNLPSQPIKAIILANEVCDAMPVHQFSLKPSKSSKEEVCFEVRVSNRAGKVVLTETTPDAELNRAVDLVLIDLGSTLQAREGIDLVESEDEKLKEQGLSYLLTESSYYTSEINLNIKPWIKSLSEILEAGLILIIDYGFPRYEYYHPSRYMGTLMCHYRHHAHSDPFFYPGLQDITAHVDFTLIAEAAIEAKLEVLGFTNQAAFLMGSDLIGIVENNKQRGMWEAEIFKQNQAIQILTSPAEMGELFKVIGLSRNFPGKLSGFALNDMRYRL